MSPLHSCGGSYSYLCIDEFWRHLTPESALLARVYLDHILARKDAEKLLEATSLPVLTAFAFYTQEACNAIFDSMESFEDARLASTDVDQFHELEDLDALLSDRIFVLEEIMKVAVKLDYTDEIGRRKMFQVIRTSQFYHLRSIVSDFSTGSILTHELFPEQLIESCLDILKKTMPSEKELVRVVVEIISQLRDNVSQEREGFEDRLTVSYPDALLEHPYSI